MNDVFISKMVKARPGKYRKWWVESKIFILLYPTCLRPAAGDGRSGKNSHQQPPQYRRWAVREDAEQSEWRKQTSAPAMVV